MLNRALIVCVGNICRSPTAEALLRHRLGERAVAVESAGLAAMRGSPIDPLAERMLVAHGLTGEGHVARQIDQPLIEGAGIVLAMERRHISALRALSPRSAGKIFLLGKWQGNIDIPDPYGREIDAFERAYRMIDIAVDTWISQF